MTLDLGLKRNSVPLRIAILQRVCPSYRVPLFKKLCSLEGADVKIFIGEDLPQTKVKSSPNLSDLNITKLKTRFIGLGSRMLPWHHGLIQELKHFKPDVILCEAESHFLGYLQAIFYKQCFSRKTGLLYWCFIELPGENEKSKFRSWIKNLTRRFFDAFVLYGSYGKKALLKQGYLNEQIFVATNVGDTQKFLSLSESLRETPSECRKKLGLPDQFTVIYLGTLDANKRPDMMLDLAARYQGLAACNIVLLGAGPLLKSLSERVQHEQLVNVFLPGRVDSDLTFYLRAADVLLIPGRGGITMSEAMAFKLPVIVYQADGTEYDLIQDQVTGLLVQHGNVDDFYQALESLRVDPAYCTRLGIAARDLIKTQFSTENMAQKILDAAKFAMAKNL